MNKADLERALKNVRGAALKEVRFLTEDGTQYEVKSARYDPENGCVYLEGLEVEE